MKDALAHCEFSSYSDIQTWFVAHYGLSFPYSSVHRWVRYGLGAKLKVARPQSIKQDVSERVAFKKKLPKRLAQINTFVGFEAPLRFWCQDESRLGLKTLPGKRITLPGIKPIGQQQWQREAYWLYSAIEPATGENFTLEFSHVDTQCFQLFLEHFSHAYPEGHHVMQCDNAPFHKARSLALPDNVTLLYQPAHCPEVNPTERFWAWIKYQLKGLNFDSLNTLREYVWHLIEKAPLEQIRSLTFWPHIQQAICNI